MALATALRGPLTRRFQTNIAELGDRAGTRAAAAFASLDSHDRADIIRFARKADPVIAAAKAGAVRTAVGYYALLAAVRPVAVTAAEVPISANVRDPFVSTWRALQAGHPYADAVAAGAARAEAVARNVVTSSARQAGDLFVAKARLNVEGWERIPDGGACPWCIEAAAGVYRTAESADFGHDRCGCIAAPILT